MSVWTSAFIRVDIKNKRRCARNARYLTISSFLTRFTRGRAFGTKLVYVGQIIRILTRQAGCCRASLACIITLNACP